MLCCVSSVCWRMGVADLVNSCSDWSTVNVRSTYFCETSPRNVVYVCYVSATNVTDVFGTVTNFADI